MALRLERIADPHTDTEELLSAIEALGPVDEPPDFWRDIAASPEYRRVHRSLAVFQLLWRHAYPGMSLEQLAALLGGAPWASHDGVEQITSLRGELPVRWNDGDSYFVVRILSDQPDGFAVYLRITGQVDREEFLRLLRGGEADDDTRQAVVVEIGFSGPVGTPPPVRADPGTGS